jgi:hypothetical protein
MANGPFVMDFRAQVMKFSYKIPPLQGGNMSILVTFPYQLPFLHPYRSDLSDRVAFLQETFNQSILPSFLTMPKTQGHIKGSGADLI